MSNNPTKYKSKKWFNIKRRKIVYGIQVRVNGEWSPVCEGKRHLIHEDKLEAIKIVKKLNKELKNEQ